MSDIQLNLVLGPEISGTSRIKPRGNRVRNTTVTSASIVSCAHWIFILHVYISCFYRRTTRVFINTGIIYVYYICSCTCTYECSLCRTSCTFVYIVLVHLVCVVYKCAYSRMKGAQQYMEKQGYVSAVYTCYWDKKFVQIQKSKSKVMSYVYMYM